MKAKVFRRRILLEATVALVVSKFAIRLASPERLMAWAARKPQRVARFALSSWPPAVSWAVDRVGGKKWMNATCLARALAGQWMLRRRGIGSLLCLGAARRDGALSAHAWLELNDAIVVGGLEAPQYTRLVQFGDAR